MKKIAVIGAGVAGLATALRLEERSDLEISVFDKSRGVSGRAATRSHAEIKFDHGAQVFEMGNDRTESFIRSLEIPGLKKVDLPVACFDLMDQVFEGDPLKNNKERWTITSGIKHLGKSMETKLKRSVLKEEEVRFLQRDDSKWNIHTGKSEFEGFDAVIFATPSPQAAQIIEKSGMDRSYRDWLSIKLREAVYRSILSFAFFWDHKVIEDQAYSALINVDRLHAITWIGLEHQKPDRTPSDNTLLVCQMSPDWSSLHFREKLGDLQEELVLLLSEIFKTSLPAPRYSNKQGWLYAIPDTLVDKKDLRTLQSEGLYFAGDSYVGGRIHLAIESGLETADLLIKDSFSS